MRVLNLGALANWQAQLERWPVQATGLHHVTFHQVAMSSTQNQQLKRGGAAGDR